MNCPRASRDKLGPPTPLEGLVSVVQACDAYAPGLFDELVRELPADAVAGWSAALRNNGFSNLGGVEVSAVASGGGAVGAEALVVGVAEAVGVAGDGFDDPVGAF